MAARDGTADIWTRKAPGATLSALEVAAARPAAETGPLSRPGPQPIPTLFATVLRALVLASHRRPPMLSGRRPDSELPGAPAEGGGARASPSQARLAFIPFLPCKGKRVSFLARGASGGFGRRSCFSGSSAELGSNEPTRVRNQHPWPTQCDRVPADPSDSKRDLGSNQIPI